MVAETMIEAADTSVADQVRLALDTVVDPEIPALTIEDMGILRGTAIEDGRVVVSITPTYSGCPAMAAIMTEIHVALARAGFDDVDVRLVHSPAWTTDWLTEEAREKLRQTGIAPPEKVSSSKLALFGQAEVTCPKCASDDTERVSEFGSTACKAHYRCRSCGEPFDYFKCI